MAVRDEKDATVEDTKPAPKAEPAGGRPGNPDVPGNPKPERE